MKGGSPMAAWLLLAAAAMGPYDSGIPLPDTRPPRPRTKLEDDLDRVFGDRRVARRVLHHPDVLAATLPAVAVLEGIRRQAEAEAREAAKKADRERAEELRRRQEAEWQKQDAARRLAQREADKQRAEQRKLDRLAALQRRRERRGRS